MRFSQFTSLIVVLAGSTAFANGFEPAEKLVGRWVSMRSSNYKHRMIRHQNYLGEMSPLKSDLDQKDGSFHVVAGLAGPGTVSFESLNFPGHYLRHQNFRIKLAQLEPNDLYRKDASFVPQPGAAGEGTTFRASNFPEHAIRHCNQHLFIDKNDGTNAECAPAEDIFRKDITFLVEEAPAVKRVSLQSINFPDHFVRHCGFEGYIDNNAKNPACNPAVFKDDVAFLLVPGLAGGNTVSFESVNYPGQYLRHQNFRVKLHKVDGTELFRKDASFERVGGLSGRESSFRSVNYPDRYLRHCSFKLFIDCNDTSNTECAPDNRVYRSDASFRIVQGGKQ